MPHPPFAAPSSATLHTRPAAAQISAKCCGWLSLKSRFSVMSGHCSRDADVSARVAIGRMRSKKSRSVGSSPVKARRATRSNAPASCRGGRAPHQILFDGKRQSGGECAVDAIVPAALVRIRVVRIEEHPPAGGVVGWCLRRNGRCRARCRGQGSDASSQKSSSVSFASAFFHASLNSRCTHIAFTSFPCFVSAA